MQLDDLLLRYFGTMDLGSISAAAQEAGVEKIHVDLGLESDPAKRFAMWALLAMNDAAPDLSETFEDEADREAARNLLDLVNAARDE